MLDSITGYIELSTKAANVGISCRESGNIDIKTGKGNVNIEGSGVSSIKAPFIRLDGNVQITGGLLADGVDLLKHIHSGVEPGNGQSGPPAGNNKVPDQVGFEWFKRHMLDSSALTDTDRLLLCLPDIAVAEAERQGDPGDAKGWHDLRNMFYKWFSGPANAYAKDNPDVFWVDWDWIMSYERARIGYTLFTYPSSPPHDGFMPNNIYNLEARGQIGEYLRRDGKFTSQREEFDYSRLLPENRYSRSFNYRKVARQQIAPFDGLQAAMGAFTLRALAVGYVEPEGDKHRITVTGVQVFIYDTFNFEKDDWWSEVFGYGYWSCKDKAFSSIPVESMLQLTNDDFNNFRDHYGLGEDFQVLSDLHVVENFQEMSYIYV